MNDTAARRWVWAPAVAALAGHLLSLRNGFALDDEVLLLRNPYLRDLEGLGEMLRSSLFITSSDPLHTDYYRPCAALLNWLSWQLFEDGRVGQHAINVTLHVGVCLLLAAVMRRHRIPAKIAAFAASLFAVHPATVELVAYVGGRQGMMGWVFVLGGWLLVSEAKQRWRCLVLALVSTVLATFSREAFFVIVVLLPVAITFADPGPPHLRRGLVTALGVGLGLSVVTIARMAVGVAWSQPRDPHAITKWLTTAAAVLLRPMKNFVAPTDLSVDLVPYEPPVALAVLVLVAAAGSLVLTLRSAHSDGEDHRALVIFGHLGLLTLTAAHTPVALLFGYTSDRYSYPFILCLTLVLTPLGLRAARRIDRTLEGRPLQPLLRPVPWIFLVLVLPITWSRVLIWHDELALQKRMYIDRPQDPMAKFAEAQRLMQLGDCVTALPLCHAYLDHFPRTHRADICLGYCYLATDKPELAIEPLIRHSRRHPHNVRSRKLLLDALFHLGRLDDVQAMIEAWGPAFADEPDVMAARRELEYLRSQP